MQLLVFSFIFLIHLFYFVETRFHFGMNFLFYLSIRLLCSHEHQSSIDLLQADEAAMADVVQERNGLHILLDP